jgi:CRP-like cAMP-binding protein
MKTFTREECVSILANSPFFHGLSCELIVELVDIAEIVTYNPDTVISRMGEHFEDVLFVISGLVRVSVCSSTGRRITFLLVKKGETYNIMSPYMKTPRLLEAHSLEKTHCLKIKGDKFVQFVERYPQITTNMIQWIGTAFDSANSRILDLMEKNVDSRIMRVLATLHGKFASPLRFTSVEISEIAGTTPESTLRTMGRLRDKGIIETRRGIIWVKDPDALNDVEFGDMIL